MAGKAKLPKNLRGRRRRFVKEYLETGKLGQSALTAGYKNPSYSNQLRKMPDVQEALLLALEAHEITNDLIAKKIKEGLDATYPLKRAPNGTIIQDRDPDYLARGTYVDRVTKIRGQNAPEKHETTERKIVIVLTPDLMKGLVASGALSKEEVAEVVKAEAVQALPPGDAPQGVIEGSAELVDRQAVRAKRKGS